MIDFLQIKSKYPMAEVVKALGLDGKQNGREFVARNPTRDDNSPGSFSINLDTAIWKDFATGDGGNDVVSLWRYVRGTGTMAAAAAELELALNGKTFSPPQPNEPDVKYEIIIPAERSRPAHPIHPKFGEPDVQYIYQGTTGFAILGFVCRWDFPDGKQIRPYFQFRSESGGISWRWAGPTDSLPLYGLHKLELRPSEVWIVEGEKTADAGQKLAPDGVAVLSWLGGTERAERVDVSALQGYTVTIIPDRDALTDNGTLRPKTQQPGMRAANTLTAKLHAVGCRVSIVDYEPDPRTHGWDLADALNEGWEPAQVLSMVRAQSRAIPTSKPKPKLPENFGQLQLYQTIPAGRFPDSIPSGNNVRLLDTWHNLECVFNGYGITCRTNNLTNQIELVHAKTAEPIQFEEVVSLATKNVLKTGHLSDHVKVIGDKNAFHPVVDWIKSVPWDGKTRIPEMFKTITLGDTDPELAFRMFFRWCISAVALVTQERMDSNGATPAAQGVLVLVGGQGINKSRWVSSLALPEFVRPNVILSTRDKDSLIASTSTWIVEWAEVSGSKNASDVQAMRAFVTGRQDTIRLPYARKAESRPRRTVYVGTENTDDFLTDPEGNRRWWTIRVQALNADHSIDRQQFWAEVYTLFKRGEQWWLTSDEMSGLNASNVSHEAADPIGELIEGGMKWDQPERWWSTSAVALSHLGRRSPSREDVRSAVKLFRALRCPERKRGHRAIEFLIPLCR